MLYRQPRFSPAAVTRAAIAWVIGFIAEFRRVDADTAYVDGLNDAALRDIGIRRIETRNERFYR